MIDTKSISYNLRSIARNYSASSVDQFCREWLVPCIEIKEVEKTDEERKNDDAKLTLQINGGMLQDLIYKQFSIDKQRPISPFTFKAGQNGQEIYETNV